MAMRDQVIHNQREALRNLWNLLMGLGLDERQILDIAAKQGITIEDWTVTPHLGLSDRKESPNLAYGRFEPFGYCPYMGHSNSTTSCMFRNFQDFGSRSFSRGHLDSACTFCREEHDNSYFLLPHDHSPSACLTLRKSSEHWVGGGPSSWFSTLRKHPQNLRHSYPEIRSQSSPYGESCMSSISHSADFGNQLKVFMLRL